MKAKKASGEAKRAAKQPLSDRAVDEALQDTFPASDPPFFVGAGAEPDTSKSEAPAEKEREPTMPHDKR
jgi:hypothetical protein